MRDAGRDLDAESTRTRRSSRGGAPWLELAVTGALLFQIRFFDQPGASERGGAHRSDPRLLVVLAVVLAATLFGSLAAMLHHGGTGAASAVALGLAISILPILLRVLPPLTKDVRNSREQQFRYAVLGLLGYVVVVASVIALLNL